MRLALLAVLTLSVLPAQAQELSNRLGPSLVFGNGEIISGQPQYNESVAALRIFRVSEDGWTLASTQIVDGIGLDDGFASVMDLDGRILAVGSSGKDEGRGAVYLFSRDSDTAEWRPLDPLAIEDSSAQLGSALDIHGSTLLAGAPGINSVLVVQNVGTEDQSVERLTARGLAAEDRFGASVGFDGERVYVGAPGRDSLAGAIYIFRRSDLGFAEETQLNAPAYKGLGKDLLVSAPGSVIAPAAGLSLGERMRAGTPLETILDEAPTGTGPILEFWIDDSGTWRRTSIVDSLLDRGLQLSTRIPMSVGSDRLVIGLSGSGRKLLLYERQSGSDRWQLKAESTRADNESRLGSTLTMDGNQVAALAPGTNYNLGAIVVLDITDNGMERSGRFALVEEISLTRSGRVDCDEGAALHFGCSNVDLLAFMPVGDLGGEIDVRLNDIWGWTDPETGREFALVGRSDGTAFVDVSSPSDPVFVGDLPLTKEARPSSWRDIKVYNNHAFIVADGAGPHGMQVFDLTHLRDVSAPPATFEALTTYDGVGSSHNIVINEATGYAYIVGAGGSGETCGGGLHMVNIQDPANPVFEGCFADTETGRSGTGYSHDAQCVIYNGPDADYSGREICFNSNETALSISDVTDKENPVAISSASFPNVSYAHQGWLTEDQSFFFMNDELDELGGNADRTRTMIWDVSDLDDPQLAREFFSENTSSDHNLYIRGNLMYQSNYGSGLRIFDITDLTNPVEVGFFDTITVVPDQPGFIGSWSNYPFFESGTIVVTSMGEGLFMLKKRDVDI